MIDENELKVTDWADANNIFFIYNPKDLRTLKSGRWGSETNTDLCFVSTDEYGKPMSITRQILKNFPHSQLRSIFLEIDI